MAISTLRKITDEDHARLQAAADRHIKKYKHLGVVSEGDSWQDVSGSVYMARHDERRSTWSEWQKAFCRALKEPYSANLTTGYGYVGHYVDQN